jgi:lipoyl(octanoyl) transferase
MMLDQLFDAPLGSGLGGKVVSNPETAQLSLHLAPATLRRDGSMMTALPPDSLTDTIDWTVSRGLTEYAGALAHMEARAAAIAAGEAPEQIWLVEHPPLYTAGTSAAEGEMLDPRFPVFSAGRGGRYTYHGPGQRVGYVMLDLRKRGQDVRCFVHALESWIIAALGQLGVECWRAPGRIGIWTHDSGQEAKIGAIGVRVRRWVTFHGFAINVAPNLSHFSGIIPCGLPDFGVTSLEKLGASVAMAQMDESLKRCFNSFLSDLSSTEKNV